MIKLQVFWLPASGVYKILFPDGQIIRTNDFNTILGQNCDNNYIVRHIDLPPWSTMLAGKNSWKE